ncbi:uncharacterized protein LOC131433293 [Malaya genurostris]|uniref:uncharacterized protein LOC131433293 n=1 Tax=Malaya genurostris TaxID=325434 RepID=UPI0026F3852B|nr:uncharacterized protein LOC131433293 [Malaya genurostris]
MSQTLPEVPCNNPTQFCRLCFSRQNIHWVIRTNGTEVDLPFINTIGSCLGVWLKLDEDFPCAVCRKCTTEIERIIEFRENCRLCDEALKQKRQNDPTALVLFYDLLFHLDNFKYVETCSEIPEIPNNMLAPAPRTFDFFFDQPGGKDRAL